MGGGVGGVHEVVRQFPSLPQRVELPREEF